MARILLITAPRPKPGDSPVHFGDNRPPQSLGYLAAYVEKHGHKADILDLYAFGSGEAENNPFVQHEEMGQGMDMDLFGHIESFQPDFIGMYVHSMSMQEACDLSARLKYDYPHIRQVCGGPHPTILPDTMPETFDHVVIGHGEGVLLDIMDGWATDRILTGMQLTSKDLEELPWPDFDRFWGKPYNWGLKLWNRDVAPVLTISTSRGCPFRCRFCAVKSIYPKYICISAGRLFARMQELEEKYGVTTFYFREDNFTANLKRLGEFCELVSQSGKPYQWVCESRVNKLSETMIQKMAAAGCLGLYIGCESGSPRVLKIMKKGETVEDYLEKIPLLHAAGINTYTSWVFGVPGETPEDRRLTDEVIEKLSPTAVDRFVYIGFPRSDFYDEILESGEYEFIDRNGFVYPNGYLDLSTALYGERDPRVQCVRRLYEQNEVTPGERAW